MEFVTTSISSKVVIKHNLIFIPTILNGVHLSTYKSNETNNYTKNIKITNKTQRVLLFLKQQITTRNMNIIEKLNWRYATKHFDPTKKLTEEQLNLVLEATNLAPSSFGLQPFSIVVIEDQELRKHLLGASHNQPQTVDASHLVLFAANTNLSDKDVDAFIRRISDTRNVSVESLAEYEALMKNSIHSLPAEAILSWATKQTYIALGQLMVTCAVEGIDTCPMEGFDKKAFDELLGLPARNLTSVVMAAVGFRSADDKYQHLTKVRKSLDELVIKL